MEEAALLPVVVPPLSKVERAQGSQHVARLGSPLHPTPCLAAHEEALIGVLRSTAADGAARPSTLTIGGDPCSPRLEVVTEVVDRLEISGVPPLVLEHGESLLHMAGP